MGKRVLSNYVVQHYLEMIDLLSLHTCLPVCCFYLLTFNIKLDDYIINNESDNDLFKFCNCLISNELGVVDQSLIYFLKLLNDVLNVYIYFNNIYSCEKDIV